MNIRIGITDGRMFDLYADWISNGDEDIELIRLGYAFDNLNAIEHCQALFFTGGEDVHPSCYNRMDYLPYCDPPDFNRKRDAFEWELLKRAVEKKLPILGICRGLQLINVFYGGTLIPDIPSWGKFNHAKAPDGHPRNHPVKVDRYSNLYNIVKQEAGEINSLHHQSADRIGKGLVATALSPDGVVEALERKPGMNEPFLLLVQWHPERMDPDSPFVRNIREIFLYEVMHALT